MFGVRTKQSARGFVWFCFLMNPDLEAPSCEMGLNPSGILDSFHGIQLGQVEALNQVKRLYRAYENETEMHELFSSWDVYP